MQKTVMSQMEKFLKMATSEPELARFFSSAGDDISKVVYENGRTVYQSIENGVRKFFSINPLTNTIKEGVVTKGLNALGQKSAGAKVVYHEGALRTVNATRIFNNKHGVGNVVVNAGGKTSAVYNSAKSAVRI